MNKKEKQNIVKALKEILKPYPKEDKRQIFWSLLHEHISQDIDGVQWMYYKLEDFVKNEFSKKSN